MRGLLIFGMIASVGRQAKAVCGRCKVVETCLDWAMESGQVFGVWGGLSEDERRALKRRKARVLRAS
jgi:WhiB family redox-sensing transcriptional regulator